MLRRLRSSFKWAALLIRLTDLVDQNQDGEDRDDVEPVEKTV